MEKLLAQMLAALAALSAATGGAVESNRTPDRPAIVQSVPASVKGVQTNSLNQSTSSHDGSSKTNDDSSKAKQVEIAGTIKSITTSGNKTTIQIGDQTITIDSTTKVEGKLVAGAKVEIEAIKQDNGNLVASEVHVEGKDDKSLKSGNTNSNDDKSNKSGSDDTKKDDKSGKSGSDDSKKDDKSEKSGSDDSKKDDSSGKSGDGSGHR